MTGDGRVPAATWDHYRQVRDMERDTDEWRVRSDLHAEPGHSPLISTDPRGEYEPTAENG
jgi:hypothetical protein